MEDSNYFVKGVGLESYIDHEKNFCGSPSREDMNNLDYNQMEESVQSDKDGICDKQDVINCETTAHIEADDFFSSLELQSSSKNSSMLSLNFPSKLWGGIVTRSRFVSSMVHDPSKTNAKSESKPKTKQKPKKNVKKRRSERLMNNRKGRKKVKSKKRQKSSERKDKVLGISEENQQNQNKLDETIVEKSLGFDKGKDESDWVLFNQFGSRKEMDDKLFEGKHVLSNDLQNPIKRVTPEPFSMSSILMSDAMSEERDDVDKLLEVEDYDDDPFLEMEEFNYAPPRLHTGGKWKPGSLSIRTSPMLWQNQTWDTLLDDRSQYEDGKSRAETPIDSPTESGDRIKDSKFSSIILSGGKCKPSVPPSSHTGGKWKPLTPPATHTGGKWKPLTPPATHTGGKWKPPDIPQRSKKSEQDLLSADDGVHNLECYSRQEVQRPPTLTGGKWKPGSDLNHTSEPEETISSKSKEVTSFSGKSSSDSRSALDVLENQSTSGKNFRCTKTSGGTVQYHCLPCNRRLSSKQLYKSHIQTDLHCRRVLQECDLEYDSRVIKLYQQTKKRERDPGKRVIKKPDLYNDTDMISKKETESLPTVRMRGKRVSKREIIRCDVCKIKLPTHQLGKHLVSYYHSRRKKPNDPGQRELILKNIHSIVKQAPYQCGMCKFYCNTHTLFKKHWALPIHKELEQSQNQKQRFWCAFCSYECETAKSMELHLDSNSHREVIWAVNKSMPIIIRHKVIFTCKFCDKEFRFNRELFQHQQRCHTVKVDNDPTERYECSICQHLCKSLKSLQVHIVTAHKDTAKIPYYCRLCDEYFSTALEAKSHRNGQLHKYRRSLLNEGDSPVKGLSRTCFYCLETLENIEKLKRHFVKKHPEHRPRCIKCGKVFALSQEVSHHVRNNACPFPQSSDESRRKLKNSADFLSCDLCAFSTMYKSEMLIHIAIHNKKDNDKRIVCPICGSQFSQSALRIHLRAHLNEAVFKCSICLRGFVRKDRYVQHLKTKHFINKTEDPFQGESSDDEEKGPEAKPKSKKEKKQEHWIKRKKQRRKCGDPNCRYEPKDKEDSEHHRRVHIGPKAYKCMECVYVAASNTILKRHLLAHADARSFPCPHCSFTAKMKNHLKRHLKTHSYAKPYKCPYCPHTCNVLENLRKHVLNTKQHVGKKLFQCKPCRFRTNRSKEFVVHYAEKHNGDPKDPKEAYIAAGLYNREEETLIRPKGIRSLREPPASKTSKKNSPISDEDILPYTKKFCSIAPKPSSREGEESVEKSVPQISANVVEFKVSGMEVEVVEPKSYPSPSEKDLTMKEGEMEEDEVEEAEVEPAGEEIVTIVEQETLQDVSSLDENEESQIMLMDISHSRVVQTDEEEFTKAKDNDTSISQTEEPCVLYQPCVVYQPCVFYQPVDHFQRTPMYVVQNVQMVQDQGLMYLI